MAFDYSKLLGKIKEAGYTLQDFAVVIGFSSQTFTSKLCGVTQFKADEMVKICDTLGVEHIEIPAYFFKQKLVNSQV